MRVFKKEVCFTVALFPLVFLAVGVLFILNGYSDYQEYYKAVDITAIVSKCEYEHYIDSDGFPDHDFDVYVDYTFNGVEYSDIHWATQSSAMKIGETATVKVHPDHPDELYASSPFLVLFVGVLFTLFGIIMSVKMIPESFSRREIFGLDFNAPRPTSRKRYLFVLIPVVPGIVFLLLGIFLSSYFYIGVILFAYFTVVLLEMLTGGQAVKE